MIDYRPARTEDGPELAELARAVFAATFGHLYPPEDFATFADRAFGPSGLPAQIDDPDFTIRLALSQGRIVGFCKLGPIAFPGDWPTDGIELHQLYVDGDFLGEGVGPALMDWAIETARTQGKGMMVLSVYIDNHRAKRFYARYGFRDIGGFDFHVGNTIDEDRLMRIEL